MTIWKEPIGRMTAEFERLYTAARAVVNPGVLSEYAEAGGVGAAIETYTGHIYTGVCIDTACSMGFCAEHAAAAAMLTAGESRIRRVIAVGAEGQVMPPCGRCREFLTALAAGNRQARVMVDQETELSLGELLPWDWKA